jgi:hypothetical protein
MTNRSYVGTPYVLAMNNDGIGVIGFGWVLE